MQATAISAPSPSAPRAQRPNKRKSGLTTALQKQSQAQHQSQTQSQPRSNANGCNSNGSRHAHRSSEQAHHRHQSMPPQQRAQGNQQPKADMTNVTILKRASAAPVSKSAGPVDIQSPLPHKMQQQQQQQQQQHRNNYSPKPRPPSQQQQSSKTRRVQNRKEAQADLEQAMQHSPTLDPSSPPSSSDSDDSESALTRLPGQYLRRQLASSPPHRPNSAPAAPQLRRGLQNVDAGRGVHPMDVPQRPSTAAVKAHSADKVQLVEKKSPLYAGPTFHNSPAPASLPIPAFARSATNSPAETSVERLFSEPFFAEAASPQLNSMRPHVVSPSTTGWSGHYSMPAAQSYNVPERMATSSFTPHVEQHGVDQLMEISQSLRQLLKIQSQ